MTTSSTAPKTVDGEYRVLDNTTEPDDFDQVVTVGGTGTPSPARSSDWLKSLANPSSNLTDLAIILAPTAYLYDMAVRRGAGMGSQVVYVAAGAALGVVALHVARKNGWLS